VVFQQLGPEFAEPRHPAQIYEAIGYFFISLLLFYVVKRYSTTWKSGRILGVTFALGWSWRFGVEFCKINQMDWEAGLPLNMGQMLSIPFIILGVLMAFGWHVDKPYFRWLNTPPRQSQNRPAKS
jgi:prolipoprotein diacylglyceryltransferase